MEELREYGIEPVLTDPVADEKEAKRLYGVEFVSMDAVREMDAVVLAVSHQEFLGLSLEKMDALFKDTENEKKVLVEVKGILDRQAFISAGYRYWRL